MIDGVLEDKLESNALDATDGFFNEFALGETDNFCDVINDGVLDDF